MAVYRILVTKQVHSIRRHTWSTEYIVVLDTPYDIHELDHMRQTVAPLLAEFESHFYSIDVQLNDVSIFPLLASPNVHISAWYGPNRHGLRPFAITESADPTLGLHLTFQSVKKPWGSKTYRYAFLATDIELFDQHDQLRPASYQALHVILSTAQQILQPLLQADPHIPSLALNIGSDRHLPQAYVKRYVHDISLTGIGRIAYGSYAPNQRSAG